MNNTTPLTFCEHMARLKGELHRMSALSELKAATKPLRERYDGIGLRHNRGQDVGAGEVNALENEITPYLQRCLETEITRFRAMVREDC